MTGIATGGSSRVILIKESTYGVTPTITPGATKVIPYVSTGLNLTRSIIENPTIRGNRTNDQKRSGNSEVSGDIQMAVSYGNIDDLLSSAMYNNWTANVLTVGDGSVQNSYSMEIGHVDIDQYRTFTGVIADTMTFEFTTEGVVNLTCSLTGKGMSLAQTSIDSAPTAASDTQPMVHFDGTFKEGGATNECIVSATVELNNGIARNYCLGNRDPSYLTTTNVVVSGTIEVFFKNETMLEKFLDETDSSLEFTLQDPDGNKYILLMNKVRYTTNAIEIGDAGVIPMTFEFEALDDGTNSPLKITRVPA